MDKMRTCLWFDTQAEEAANYYVSVFEDSKVLDVSYYGKDMPMPEGTVLLVNFKLAGREFQALNGGPEFKFSEAVSISVNCDDQAEIDRLWGELTSNGGEESVCGWLKDKYGLSWQIVPTELNKMISDPDGEKVNRVMAAVMQMVKPDIATLRKAYAGELEEARH